MDRPAKKTETAKAAAKSVTSGSSAKDRVKMKAALMSELIEESDEAEAEMLEGLFAKVFAKKQ